MLSRLGGLLVLAVFAVHHAHAAFVDSSGVPIHYQVHGDGPPVFLLHGFAQLVEGWQEGNLLDQLANEFQVIAIDARGHGASGKPTDPDAYGKQMVKDIVVVMDQLDIDQAIIVGYSNGAAIGLRLTIDYPGRVKALVMGGAGWTDDWYLELYRQVASSMRETRGFGGAINWMNANHPAGKLPGLTKEEVLVYDEALRKTNNLDALAAAADSMGQILTNTEAEITDIDVPVLGVTGGLDPDKMYMERMSKVAKDYTLVVLNGRHHHDTPSDPRFIVTIRDFLRYQSSR